MAEESKDSPLHGSGFAAKGRIVIAALLILASADATPVFGQPLERADPLRFLQWPVQDVGAIVGSVNSNGLAVLGAGAAIYAIAQRDPGLKRALQEAGPEPHGVLFRAVEEFGNIKAVQPAALMLFLGSLASGDEKFQDAAFTSLESVIVAHLFTNVLKAAFGRSRPYQDDRPRFSPFSGDTSFPSGHSATAFAFVTPWMLYYPNLATGGLMVVSAGTALSRVVSNFHWVSDVLAGSTIGFATAYILSQTHLNRSESLRISPVLTEGGAGISVAVRH